MRWTHYRTAKVEMSSATVCNCQHNTPDPESLRAMSSRQSGQQQRTPDGRTCSEPVAWHRPLVTAGRTQTLAENDVRNWWTVVHQVPRSLVVLASVHHAWVYRACTCIDHSLCGNLLLNAPVKEFRKYFDEVNGIMQFGGSLFGPHGTRLAASCRLQWR